MVKICNKCSIGLSVCKFSKNKHEKDGLQKQCKDCAKKMQKEWRKNNPEKLKKSIKTWAQNNKKERNQYAKKRRHSNPQWLILNRLRSRFDKVLNGTIKTDSTMSLLGCSMQSQTTLNQLTSQV